MGCSPPVLWSFRITTFAPNASHDDQTAAMNPFALPVHPIVVHFPLAMLAAAWVCALSLAVTGRTVWSQRTELFEAVGVLALPVTIAAGFVDTRGLGPLLERKWDQPLIWHVLISLVAAAMFFGHLLWRRRQATPLRFPAAAVDIAWLTLGLWMLVLSGAIAGEMVYAA